MEKNEFKTKVLYGSAEDLILYKNKGIIDPYAMVAEFPSPTLALAIPFKAPHATQNCPESFMPTA